MIRLLAFVLPLGLDSFAVAAALGAARPAGLGARLRVLLIFIVFEAGMPLLGIAVGERFRERAEQLAAVALIVLGAYLIAERALA